MREVEFDRDAVGVFEEDLFQRHVRDLALAEGRARVVRGLSALPPELRSALELTYYDALSHSEIAEKLKMPLGTVKTRIRQAILRLRDLLQEPGD